MSMIGLATRPGTDVDPWCSMRSARSPRAARIRSSSSRKRCGHAGSYSASVTCPLRTTASPTVAARISSSIWGNVERAPAPVELLRLVGKPGGDRLPLVEPVGCGVLPYVLADAHRAELRPAHRAEVGLLGGRRRQ